MRQQITKRVLEMVGELPQPPTRADLLVSLLVSDWSLAGYPTSDWLIVNT